jgi:hypothetical protein
MTILFVFFTSLISVCLIARLGAIGRYGECRFEGDGGAVMGNTGMSIFTALWNQFHEMNTTF